MPVLHLQDVPLDLYQRLQRLAAAHQRTPEGEALALLQEHLRAAPPGPSQAELLADLKRRSFRLPPGTPDSVDLLREDRER
jgi:plasmid stability protein